MLSRIVCNDGPCTVGAQIRPSAFRLPEAPMWDLSRHVLTLFGVKTFSCPKGIPPAASGIPLPAGAPASSKEHVRAVQRVRKGRIVKMSPEWESQAVETPKISEKAHERQSCRGSSCGMVVPSRRLRRCQLIGSRRCFTAAAQHRVSAKDATVTCDVQGVLVQPLRNSGAFPWDADCAGQSLVSFHSPAWNRKVPFGSWTLIGYEAHACKQGCDN